MNALASPSVWGRMRRAWAVLFARPEVAVLYPPRAHFGPVEIVPGLTFIPLGDNKARLEVSSELEIRGAENLSITTRKHLFFESGMVPETDRPAYNYSIWSNQRHFDDRGRPLQLVPIYGPDDRLGHIPLPLTPDGRAAVDRYGYHICPEGFTPLPAASWRHLLATRGGELPGCCPGHT